MTEYDWKQSLPLLKLLAKSKMGSTLLVESLRSNQRCAMHELLHKGFVIVYCDKDTNIYSVRLSEKGYQEVFAESI